MSCPCDEPATAGHRFASRPRSQRRASRLDQRCKRIQLKRILSLVNCWANTPLPLADPVFKVKESLGLEWALVLLLALVPVTIIEALKLLRAWLAK